MENMIVDGVYLHINNGGVEFAVTQNEELALEIKASHFGNTTNTVKLYVKPANLERLGNMMIEAARQAGVVADWLLLESYLVDKETGELKEQISNEKDWLEVADGGATAGAMAPSNEDGEEL